MRLTPLELRAANEILKILDGCSNVEALNILNKVMIREIQKGRGK